MTVPMGSSLYSLVLAVTVRPKVSAKDLAFSSVIVKKFGMVTGTISLPELTYRITLYPFLIGLPADGLEVMT